MPRMIKASMRGEYDGGLRLFLMAAASLYIVSPIDAIPELFFLVLRPDRRRVRGHLAGRRAAVGDGAVPGVGEERRAAAPSVIAGRGHPDAREPARRAHAGTGWH